MNKYEVGQLYTVGHIPYSSTGNMYEGKLVEIKEIGPAFITYNFVPILETNPKDREFETGTKFDKALTLLRATIEVEFPTEIPNFKPVHDFNILFGGQ